MFLIIIKTIDLIVNAIIILHNRIINHYRFESSIARIELHITSSIVTICIVQDDTLCILSCDFSFIFVSFKFKFFEFWSIYKRLYFQIIRFSYYLSMYVLQPNGRFEKLLLFTIFFFYSKL